VVLNRQSAIYRGTIRHRRFAPHPNEFTYNIFMFYIDLDEIDQLFADYRFWSVNRGNLFAFHRSDYMDPQIPSLREAVHQTLTKAGVTPPGGPIRLLTHLRYFGFCFNPVSFYYCYAADGQKLVAIVSEITNTPWNERHSYVHLVAQAQRKGSAFHFAFNKAFHVSPFLPMDMHYDWAFQAPDEHLRVHMNVMQDAKQFDSTLSLGRVPIDRHSLRQCALSTPPMTFAVAARIYWQALKIRLKGNRFYEHPKIKGKP
jgi:uncharacterized protein